MACLYDTGAFSQRVTREVFRICEKGGVTFGDLSEEEQREIEVCARALALSADPSGSIESQRLALRSASGDLTAPPATVEVV